jgi:hypothetical protein
MMNRQREFNPQAFQSVVFCIGTHNDTIFDLWHVLLPMRQNLPTPTPRAKEARS